MYQLFKAIFLEAFLGKTRQLALEEGLDFNDQSIREQMHAFSQAWEGVATAHWKL